MENSTREVESAILDENIEVAIAVLFVENLEYNWVLDSYTSRHFSSDPHLFSILDQNTNQGVVTMA